MDRTLNNDCHQAGIIDEMMEDMLEAEEDEEIEQEADAEVDKILFDLTNGKLGQAGTVGTELPVCCLPFRFVLADIYIRSPHRTSWKTRRRSGRWKSTASS